MNTGMSDINIEIGVRVTSNLKDFDPISFCTKYDLYHIQLYAENFSTVALFNNLKVSEFETSLFLNFWPEKGELDALLEEIVSKKHKFLVLPFNGLLKHDVRSLLLTAERERFFICANTFIKETENLDFEKLIELKRLYAPHFFLFSFSALLNETPQLSSLLKKYRLTTGIVHLNLDTEFITSKSSFPKLSEFLENLIYLPYSQQPLVLTGDDNVITLALQSIFGPR